MNLFQLGNFKLHSGAHTNFKIECDALTAEDWDALAFLLIMRIGRFSTVVGVPTGGEQFAKALHSYRTSNIDTHSNNPFPVLVVDDVLTTGNSIIEVGTQYERWVGGVAFCRNPSFLRTHPHVFSIFDMPIAETKRHKNLEEDKAALRLLI